MLDSKVIAALVTPVVMTSDHSMGLMEIAWKAQVPSDQIDVIRDVLDRLADLGKVVKVRTRAPFPNYTYMPVVTKAIVRNPQPQESPCS